MLKRETHLPVIVDPSHAGGKAWLVSALASAAVAAGADGLLVEMHPNPPDAWCDADQALTPAEFAALMRKLGAVAEAVGRGPPASKHAKCSGRASRWRDACGLMPRCRMRRSLGNAGRPAAHALDCRMFELVDVVHRYGEVPAVEVPEWKAGAGEAWLLSGPSGCGKSTVLHLLAGLIVPTHGTVLVAGIDLRFAVRRRARPLARPHVGLVPQRLHLVGPLCVRDNLRLAQTLPGLPVDDARSGAARSGRRRRPHASLSA